MKTELPAYYSSLTPFRETFERGRPILMYHKLGPRPARARMKGLYVSAKLFATQLQELQAAGFASGSLNAALTINGPRQAIITFDDGYVNVLQHGLTPLAQTGFKAMQFLPVDYLGKANAWDVANGEVSAPIMDASQVRTWLAAGHEIGSHTLSHPHLTQLSQADAREEIFSSRKKLEDLFGVRIEHFCYPYGDWNPAVRDLVAAAGYRTACITTAGLNAPDDSPFALKRFTARYPTRNWKALREKVRRMLGAK